MDSIYKEHEKKCKKVGGILNRKNRNDIKINDREECAKLLVTNMDILNNYVAFIDYVKNNIDSIPASPIPQTKNLMSVINSDIKPFIISALKRLQKHSKKTNKRIFFKELDDVNVTFFWFDDEESYKKDFYHELTHICDRITKIEYSKLTSHGKSLNDILTNILSSVRCPICFRAFTDLNKNDQPINLNWIVEHKHEQHMLLTEPEDPKYEKLYKKVAKESSSKHHKKNSTKFIDMGRYRGKTCSTCNSVVLEQLDNAYSSIVNLGRLYKKLYEFDFEKITKLTQHQKYVVLENMKHKIGNVIPKSKRSKKTIKKNQKKSSEITKLILDIDYDDYEIYKAIHSSSFGNPNIDVDEDKRYYTIDEELKGINLMQMAQIHYDNEYGPFSYIEYLVDKGFIDIEKAFVSEEFARDLDIDRNPPSQQQQGIIRTPQPSPDRRQTQPYRTTPVQNTNLQTPETSLLDRALNPLLSTIKSTALPFTSPQQPTGDIGGSQGSYYNPFGDFSQPSYNPARDFSQLMGGLQRSDTTSSRPDRSPNKRNRAPSADEIVNSPQKSSPSKPKRPKGEDSKFGTKKRKPNKKTTKSKPKKPSKKVRDQAKKLGIRVTIGKVSQKRKYKTETALKKQINNKLKFKKSKKSKK